MEKAAQEVMGEHDADVAEALFVVSEERGLGALSINFFMRSFAHAPPLPCSPPLQGKFRSAKQFKKWLCGYLTDACAATPPAVPKVSQFR